MGTSNDKEMFLMKFSNAFINALALLPFVGPADVNPTEPKRPSNENEEEEPQEKQC